MVRETGGWLCASCNSDPALNRVGFLRKVFVEAVCFALDVSVCDASPGQLCLPSFTLEVLFTLTFDGSRAGAGSLRSFGGCIIEMCQ